MLPKKNRLPATFFHTRKRPLYSFIEGGVSVRVYQTGNPMFRSSVIIPVKTASRAVVRNKIRRVVYNYLYTKISKLPAVDVVLFISHTETITSDIARIVQTLSTMKLNI